MPDNRFTKLFAEADEAFDGKYKDELNKLMALSKDEIDDILPGTTDLRAYNVLVRVVEDASRDNLSQAQLAENIRALGEVGVKIARRIPSLKSLL